MRPSSPLLVLQLISVLPLFLAPSLHAQTASNTYWFSRQLPTIETRSMGMGGTGIAGWNDPSALHTNPAGLGYYSTSEVSGGLNALMTQDNSVFQVFVDGPSAKHTGETSSIQLGHLAGIHSAEIGQSALVFAVGFNQVSTFNRQLSYGGINRSSSITDTFLPFDDEYEITSESIDIFPAVPFVAYQAGAIEFFESRFQNGEYPFLQAVPPGRRIRQQGSVTRGGSMKEINFAGAGEITPDVMIGGSANISYGTYAFNHELKETDLEGADNYSVVTGNELLADFERILVRERSSSDIRGFNFRLGVSAEIVQDIRFGFTVETPTWYSITEDFTNAFVRTTFSNGSLAYGDNPGENETQGQTEYRLNTPWRLGTGLSYSTESLLVTADVVALDWSQTSFSSDEINSNPKKDDLQQEYSQVLNWCGGAEYRFDIGLRLRAGGAYYPDARDVAFRFANGNVEDRSRFFFSGGIGFALNEQVSFDAAWMQERSKDQFTPYPSLVPANESEPIANPLIDENIVRNQFQIGATYRF